MLSAERFRWLLVPLSLVVGLCLCGAPQPASAHEGHEGPEANAVAPAPPGVSLSPRLVARSSDFELVGVARGRTLSIYLDRFADNQPVIGAKLDVEVDGQTMSATAEPSGIYTLTANWVAQAGHHDVIVTILSDQGSDLLAGTLEVPSAPAAASPSGNGGVLPALVDRQYFRVPARHGGERGIAAADRPSPQSCAEQPTGCAAAATT